MKNIFKIIFFVSSLSILFASCGKDNYDEPTSLLKGKITYNGEAVQVRGTDEKVRLQFYQYGYAKNNAIDVFVTQDGTFSAMLFDGDYHVVTKDGNGPWVNSRDTTVINVRGNTEMELKVTPFFTISPDATVTVVDTTVTATLNISKIVETAEIGRVVVCLGTTMFVDEGFNLLREEFKDGKVNTGDLKCTVELNVNQEDKDKALATKKVLESKILFARICVVAKGADQGIYSSPIRLR